MPPSTPPDLPERLDQLGTLLQATIATVRGLTGDPVFVRLAAAFDRMPPEDRETVVGAVEREVDLRILTQKSECATLSGYRVTGPNPNARLYLRVLEKDNTLPALGHDDMTTALLQSMMKMPVLLSPALHEQFTNATCEAFGELDADGQEQVLRLLREMLAVCEGTRQPLRPRTATGL